MRSFVVETFGLADVIAVLWFLVAWIGYGWFSERSRWAQLGLQDVGDQHRVRWARQLISREMRMTDAALVGNLMQSVSFYASTTIYIIAGLLALLGTLDQLISFASDLPFARETSRALWEVKLLLLLGVIQTRLGQDGARPFNPDELEVLTAGERSHRSAASLLPRGRPNDN